jgi:glutamate 5-kinase
VTAEVPARAGLRSARRIVVKIGSALLAHGGERMMKQLATQIAALREEKREVLLVSSGAIALGLSVLGLKKRPSQLGQLQAAAAAGQPELMRRWIAALGRVGVPVAQVLLTHADLADRTRFLNTRRAVAELLARGVLPIANENDTVATEEIKVGDNDQLSAHLASLIQADLLVLLTTVDGLYESDPEKNPDAKRLALVDDPRAVAHLAGGSGSSGLGVGGMSTKVLAARAATQSGIAVVITAGARPGVLGEVMAGDDVGTLFVPQSGLQSRKHWIGFTLKPQGSLHIDAGAAKAVARAGKSLLPSGLVRVEGRFERGAMVEIVGPEGVVARGLAAYPSDELGRIAGKKSAAIEEVLGYVDTPEVVHRDDMVLV